MALPRVLTFVPLSHDQAVNPVASLTFQRRVGRGAPVTWKVTPRMAERRARMRDVGARLFARSGVTGVSVMDVAQAADVPVSPAAHGYRRRPDLVFDILHAYVDVLHEYVGSADEAHETSVPELRLLAVITALLHGIHEHRDAHYLMLSMFPTLSEDRQEILRYQMRTLIYRLAGPLSGVVPGLMVRRDLQVPLLQSLIGMASHAPTWFRETGALSRPAYAALIARAIIDAGRAAITV
ncbi:MAG: hypothetical protein AB7O80_25590 [Acetobacteraceae bacterium]